MGINLTPLPWAGCNTRSISKRSTVGWIQNFLTIIGKPWLKNTVCPTIYSCLGGIHWIHAIRDGLMRSETQTSSSRILTRVTDSISCTDNRYTRWASKTKINYEWSLQFLPNSFSRHSTHFSEFSTCRSATKIHLWITHEAAPSYFIYWFQNLYMSFQSRK